ncbi:hypothetical protein MKW98_006164 [Papaver atlanticum]|uniref:Uncharacterized protein n=1 Tax=Papaver atlanticum TaxID=357466 RepID=A0AAD4TE24_9MAGN|nr:hypothetical protein MKW98_006164 [Papaver atlanticum]
MVVTLPLLIATTTHNHHRHHHLFFFFFCITSSGVGGIIVAGVAFQEKLVYVPVLPGLTKSYPITPSRLLLGYEDVWLNSSDGDRLHAWFIKLFPDCRGVLLPFLKWSIEGIDIVGQDILFLSGLQDEKTLYVKPATHDKNCLSVEFPYGMHMVSGGDLCWNTARQFLEQNVSGKKQKITHQSENGPTIPFFQENAGHIAIMLQKLQYIVFMVSYRGYGASDGYPFQHGITRDAQAALEHLAQRTDIDTLFLVGHLGAQLVQCLPKTILIRLQP